MEMSGTARPVESARTGGPDGEEEEEEEECSGVDFYFGPFYI